MCLQLRCSSRGVRLLLSLAPVFCGSVPSLRCGVCALAGVMLVLVGCIFGDVFFCVCFIACRLVWGFVGVCVVVSVVCLGMVCF